MAFDNEKSDDKLPLNELPIDDEAKLEKIALLLSKLLLDDNQSHLNKIDSDVTDESSEEKIVEAIKSRIDSTQAESALKDSPMNLLGSLAASFLGYGHDKANDALEELGLPVGSSVRKRLTEWLVKDLLRSGAQQKTSPYPAEDAGNKKPDEKQSFIDTGDLQELPDNIMLAILVAKRNIARLPPAQVAGYLVQSVVPAMRRFRNEGETPERVVDLLVEPAKGRLPLKWTKTRADALLRLMAYLETQTGRTRGFYGTCAQLATLLRGDVSPDRLPAVAAIYHRVLIHPPAETGADVMAKTANNLTGRTMGALRAAFGGSDAEVVKNASPEMLQAINRIHALAAVCTAAENEPAGKLADTGRLERLRNAYAAVPGLTLPGDAAEVGRKVAVWLMMTNALGAWHYPDPGFFGQQISRLFNDSALVPLALAGALARIELVAEDERNEIGHAFSNLSNMAGRDGTADKDAAMSAAVCLAAVGLWQVAILSKDDGEILGDYRGLDIALRLLARLDDMSPENLAKLDGLPDVLAWLANAGQRLGTEAFMMSMLLERDAFKSLPRGTVPRSRDALVETFGSLTGALLRQMGWEGDALHALDAKDGIVSTARIAVFVLKKIFDDGQFEKHAAILDKIADRLIGASGEAEKSWRTLYGPEAEQEDDPENSLRAGLAGPLTALKRADGEEIFAEEEWSRCVSIIVKADKEADPIQAAKDLLSDDDRTEQDETKWRSSVMERLAGTLSR